MIRLRLAHIAFPFLFAGALIGCGGDNASRDDAGALAGTVRIDGSSTVFPITEAVAEEFGREHPNVRVSVGASGTGGGFGKFLREETDINDASRPIKPVEIEQAVQNNIEYIELPVAYDGLAIIANPENDWAECLTVEELNKIWQPNSTVDNWSQVRSGFPDRPIRLYGPGTDSGTYDYFTEAVIGEEGASRTDYTASEDDNVLVQGVQGDPNALGFFGMAYYEANRERLKLIGVDDGDAANGEGCVQPSTETIRDGTYQPLARPIFMYVRKASMEDPSVKAFVEYYLQNAAQLAPEVGYVPLSDEAYTLGLERFRRGIHGSVFEGGGSQVGVRIEDLLQREEESVGAGAGEEPAAP